jgi:hypothetical protein
VGQRLPSRRQIKSVGDERLLNDGPLLPQPPAARAMKPVRAAFEAPMRLTGLLYRSPPRQDDRERLGMSGNLKFRSQPCGDSFSWRSRPMGRGRRSGWRSSSATAPIRKPPPSGPPKPAPEGPPVASGTAGNGLIRDFDSVPPYYLDRLFTLRRKVLPGLRVVICLRLLHAVPLVDNYTLGSRRPLQCNNPSAASAERATTGSH